MNNLYSPEHGPSLLFIPTLNKTGYMATHLDMISRAFVNHAAQCNEWVLDVGAAYGITTLAALSAGAHIVCNDIEPKHLDVVKFNVPKKYQEKLILAPGHFPNDPIFKNNFFDAILLCRLLHIFTGEEIENTIKKSYEFLKPGGKLFIVADTPYLQNIAAFLPEYQKRKQLKEKWPGLIEDVQQYVSSGVEHFPPFINLLDDEILSRTLNENNFKIERLEYLNRQDYPEDRQLDGRECVGAIAVKTC